MSSIAVVDLDIRAAIDELYARHVELIDDGDIGGWPDLFTDDGSYYIVAKENDDRGLPLALMRCESKGMILDRVRAIQQLSMYAPRVLRHVVGALRIRPSADGTRYSVTANYAVFQTLADEPTTILSTGRYRDEVVVDDEVARFHEKVCIYDNPLVPNSLVFPL